VLHRCIEGERVGDDGGEVVGVDRRHDDCPGGVPAPPGERGREPPSFFFFLGLPLDGRRFSPLVLGLHGTRRGGSPSEIGSLSLFSSVSCSCFLAFHRFLNSRRTVTPIGLKF
jgi:hypothetical protein